MNLRINSIQDLNTDKERIELEAIGNDNTTNYIILYAGSHENIEVANRCVHAFWFPNQVFKKGDIIRVFIKTGKSSSILMPNKCKRYTFYWDLQSDIASESKGYPKLLKIIELSSK